MNPIFIGGCDRSGTTLLGSMLGAAPGAVCTPESQFKTEILEKDNAKALLCSPKAALASIARHWRFSLWGIDNDRLEGLAAQPPSSYEALLERLVFLYAQGHPETNAAPAKPFIWVDHTPSNLRYLYRLFAMFPDAVAVHIVRDGRAVAASVLPLDWGPNTVYFAAKWWMQKLAPGLAAEHFFGPARVIRVRYEDLLADPESELKRICRFAGIQYSDKMAGVSGFQVPQYTAGQHSRLLSGEIDKGRAGSWRQALTQKQITLFEHAAGDLLSFLGYDLIDRWPAIPSNTLLAREGTTEILCRLKNYRRKFIRKRRSLMK